MVTWTSADVLNFKYKDLKIFMLKLGSELQKLIKLIPIRSEDVNKMQTKFPLFLQSLIHRGKGVVLIFHHA